MRHIMYSATGLTLLVLGIVAVGSEGQAEVLASLTTTADLNSLVVGQSVPFQVELSGLTGQQLDLLQLTIRYTGELLGQSHMTLPGLTEGGIVPNAADFLFYEDPDGADGMFLTYDGPYVNTNGVFFTFEATTLGPGQGSLWFEGAGAWEILQDGSHQYPIIQTNPDALTEPISVLNFTVVPEPGAWCLMITAGALLAPYYCLKRRRSP